MSGWVMVCAEKSRSIIPEEIISHEYIVKELEGWVNRHIFRASREYTPPIIVFHQRYCTFFFETEGPNLLNEPIKFIRINPLNNTFVV
jgi:hypothetical protein